jgi:hypothetical protein
LPASGPIHESKDGATIAQQSFPASTRGMVWGNIIFGGIIGVVIDYSNGAAHHYAKQLRVLGTDAGSVASSGCSTPRRTSPRSSSATA